LLHSLSRLAVAIGRAPVTGWKLFSTRGATQWDSSPTYIEQRI
jgi:hypothetical protein